MCVLDENQNTDSTEKLAVEDVVKKDSPSKEGEILAFLKEIKGILGDNDRLLKMNAEMHDELVKLRNSFIEDVKRPYIKGYLQIYDRLDDLFKANTESSSPELANAMNTVNNIKLNILDILEEFDIELVEPEINSVFNPKEHRALTAVFTDEPEKDKTIAAVKAPGFYDAKNNRCFRTSIVEVFKFQS